MKKLLLTGLMMMLTMGIVFADEAMFSMGEVQSILVAVREGSYDMLSADTQAKISPDQWQMWIDKRDAMKEEAKQKVELKKEEAKQKVEAKKTEVKQKVDDKKQEIVVKKEEAKQKVETKKTEVKAKRSALQQAVIDADYATFKNIAPADMLTKIDTEEKFMTLSVAYNKQISQKSSSSEKPEPKSEEPKPEEQQQGTTEKTSANSGRSMEAQDTQSPATQVKPKPDNADATVKRVKTKRGFWITVPA